MEPIQARLNDAPRSGRPAEISAEQWCRIVALACEPPERYARPITYWSSRELFAEVVKRIFLAQETLLFHLYANESALMTFDKLYPISSESV